MANNGRKLFLVGGIAYQTEGEAQAKIMELHPEFNSDQLAEAFAFLIEEQDDPTDTDASLVSECEKCDNTGWIKYGWAKGWPCSCDAGKGK